MKLCLLLLCDAIAGAFCFSNLMKEVHSMITQDEIRKAKASYLREFLNCIFLHFFQKTLDKIMLL